MREGEVVHSYVCVCAYDVVIILLIYDWYSAMCGAVWFMSCIEMVWICFDYVMHQWRAMLIWIALDVLML